MLTWESDFDILSWKKLKIIVLSKIKSDPGSIEFKINERILMKFRR